MKGLNGGEGFLKSGGWCLRTKGRPGDPYDVVRESNGQSYFLPHPHLAPDSAIVDFLTRLLKTCRDPPACQTHHFLSLNDFGAGVGQYGRAILARDPRYRFFGYDGAGNVEEVSKGFVRFFDLTTPLSLPRADWLMSLEVGEHIPPQHELAVIRNLHAHNCRGMILSWAYLKKVGVGHVNNHSPRYLIRLLDELGYEHDKAVSFQLQARRNKHDGSVPAVDYTPSLTNCSTGQRGGHGCGPKRLIGVRNVSREWFWLKSVNVFRRREPLRGGECTP